MEGVGDPVGDGEDGLCSRDRDKQLSISTAIVPV